MACCFCFVSTNYLTNKQLTWPKRTTRLGSFLAWRLRARTRKLLLEHTDQCGQTPLRVALRSPCGAFPAINERHVTMTLAWPWSSGRPCLQPHRIGHSTEKKHSCSNSSVGEGFNLKCPGPIGPTLCLRPLTGRSKERKEERKKLNALK